MSTIELHEACEGDIPSFDNLEGKSLLRELEPTDQVTLLANVPQWIRAMDVAHKYESRMSMSTVCYMYNNPAFNTTAIWTMMSNLKLVDLGIGMILDVSSADATTDPTEGKPVSTGPRKGRNPINPRVEPRRAHGQYKSFGTSIELKLLVRLDKGPDFNPALREREYKAKLFATNIQIPGCGNEDLSDIRRVIMLIDNIFDMVYRNVRTPPPGFTRLQQMLRDVGENPLKYPTPDDYDNVARGKIIIYSRNYTFHYKPLVDDIDEYGQNRYAINLDKLTRFLKNNPDLTRSWEEKCGLKGVLIAYTKSSDSSNRRAQFIFRTPQYSRESSNRGSQITKAFVESSGKINIELTNNYYWRDTLWRIFGFLSHLVGPYCVEARMSSNISRTTMEGPIRAMYAKVDNRIDESTVCAYLAEIATDESSEDDYSFE